MPSSIPFDHPSLVLGNIINPLLLNKLRQISSLQSKIDAAQDKLNAHIQLKRSIGLTINEMIDLNVDISELTEKMKLVDDSITKTALDYTTIRIANETSIREIKEAIAEMEIDESMESPLDWSTITVKRQPLSADSIKMESQYFSYDEDNAAAGAGVIENYIKQSTGALGNRASTDIAKAASAQINLQQKHHSLSGTLVITASCTHKNAVLLLPGSLDIDKAIPVWNRIFPASRINTGDEQSVKALTEKEDRAGESLSVLSGATYGSSFVGMVHILKQEASSAGNGPSIIDIAAGLQDQLTIGNWLQDATGGFGMDRSFSSNIRNLLNTQQVTSHVTIVVMGAIPSIRSNQLQRGIKAITEQDAGKLSSELTAISNVTASTKTTVNQAANAAKTGAKVLAMQSANAQSVITELGRIDQEANKVLDINSMMTAFEDYLQEVKKGESGVPVSFYLKPITQRQLAQQWMDKYFPDKGVPAAAGTETLKTNDQ